MLSHKALLYFLAWTWAIHEISSQDAVRRLGHGGLVSHRQRHMQQLLQGSTDGTPFKPSCNVTLEQNEDVLQTQKDDLGIRFSKIVFADESANGTSRLPLTKDDYPIDMETASWLRSSQCPSIINPENCYECDMSFETLIEAIHGEPTHPSRSPNSSYWDELREMTLTRAHRLNDTDPKEVMPIAKIWENLTIKEVAEAVHNEVCLNVIEYYNILPRLTHLFFICSSQYPGAVPVEFIKSLMANKVKVDNSTIPMRCHVEFLRGIVMLAELNTWAWGIVGPHNFGLKYYTGRARPEEIAFLISERNLTAHDGVPADLLVAIPRKSLKKMEDFTAYPEGSPMHPSWPAMHSAVSSASLWLAVVLNLTPEQWCQAKLVDYGVAYARTIAGVHFPSDNIAGLNLGQEVVASKLPGHLAIRYGSDPTVIRQKIANLRFDWRDFLDSDCAKNFRSFL
jgi:membrane-associated phospholipid phosphatase